MDLTLGFFFFPTAAVDVFQESHHGFVVSLALFLLIGGFFFFCG